MDRPPFDPASFAFQLCADAWLAKAAWAAVRRGVPDAVGDEPVELAALARATGTQPGALGRLMRALAAHGIFERMDGDRFAHSPLSRALRRPPQGGGVFLDSVLGDFHWDAWAALDASVATGRSGVEIRFGQPAFDYLADHPDEAQRFAAAMSANTVTDEVAILTNWRPGPFRRAIDVGGSHGSLVRALLRAAPEARGLVYDRSEIVATGPVVTAGDPVAARLDWEAGDFFERVPEGGDLYLLKHILHDWDDAECRTILAHVRAALAPDGRVAVFEMLLPATSQPHPAWLLDINMLVNTHGRERSEAEFAALLAQSGLRHVRTTPVGRVQVIEAVAA